MRQQMGYKGNFPQIMREVGFKLRLNKDGPLDWRQMGSYETDRILREQNFELIDDALQHLSEAPLGTVLETHILDSGIAKYFIMSQYAIQYLLCCRTFLDESVGELREAHEISQQEIARLRKSLGEANNEVVQLHKKITQIEAIREVVFPCHLCTKNFISNESLNIHMGRRHRIGTPTQTTGGAAGGAGAIVKDKDNDVQLINAIKMELEIKQLKERLNAAERNIKERSGSSRKHVSPRQDQAIMHNVGIQSNLPEYKEKDEHSSGAVESEASERKQQLHGLAERLSHFEEWQTQMKQSNEVFIEGINQKLADLSQALELSKDKRIKTVTPMNGEERVATPCLEELERILSEKVAEIGKVSANKLEEVVHHLEMGYKEKLEALERDLKRLSLRKETTTVVVQQQQPQSTAASASTSTSKIPKPLPKKDLALERIKKQVETEFLQAKRDDDTYSIEELPDQQQQQQKHSVTQVQVQNTSGNNSSGSHPTYTKPDDPKPIQGQTGKQETTDASESLSDEEEQVEEEQEEEKTEEEESISDEGSEIMTSEPERHVYNSPKTKVAPILTSAQKNPKAYARKLVNLKLSQIGFSMKSKTISNISLKRASSELAQNRNQLKLNRPHFYATRNRVRKFVDKLCSTKMPARAQVLLENKTPLQPIEVPKRKTVLLASTDEDDEEIEATTSLEGEEEDEEKEEKQASTSSLKPQRQQQHMTFKAQLEQMLAKPAAQVVSKPSTGHMQSRPVPLPRKRVMFNTFDIGKGNNEI